MFHYLYKTTSQSGRFYIGRHSTTNLQDGYIGSGKWVRSIKDKSKLKVEILSFYNTNEDLKRDEEIVICLVIDDPLNMNFNKSSVGFSTGSMNPSSTKEGRQRLMEKNWMKTDEGKLYASINNPSKKEHVKSLRSKQARTQLDKGEHNFQNPIFREKRIDAAKKRFLENNPSKTVDHISRMKSLLKEGIHPFQVKVECPYCKLVGCRSNMYRYHFENCKHKDDINSLKL